MPSPFENYENFEFKEQPPSLPVEKSEEIKSGKERIHHGGFSSTVEVDDKTIIKINRFIRVRPDSKETFGLNDARNFLVAKGDGRSEVIARMRGFANEKMETYELLGRYVGNYLPEMRGFAVVDSPRKFLEEGNLKAGLNDKPVPQEILEKLPESEISLMEVWENVHPEHSLSEMGFEDLKALYTNSSSYESLKGFANGALRLLMENRKMLDICDMGGIRTRTADGSRSRAVSLMETYHLLVSEDNKLIGYPRNTTNLGGKLKFYDTFPIFDVPLEIETELLQKLAGAVQDRDLVAMQEIIMNERGQEDRKRLYILRYLTLLEKMGAKLKEI